MGGERQELNEDKKVEEQEDRLASKIWDCGSPLYDSYELASITNVLDRHLMKFPYVINRSTRSLVRPSSYPSMDSYPSRKKNECLFLPSFKLCKIKMNKDSKVKVGISRICQRAESKESKTATLGTMTSHEDLSPTICICDEEQAEPNHNGRRCGKHLPRRLNKSDNETTQ
nr:hypothetical protein [Tanacetum cinerariifolium]